MTDMARRHSNRVLVLNHFAIPRSSGGGTRHVELFERLEPDIRFVILASNRGLFDRRLIAKADPRFTYIWTSPYRSNGLTRVLNWITYAIGASVVGSLGQRPRLVYASSPHLLAGLAGWAIAKLRRVPFVLEIRDLWPQVLVDMGSLDDQSLVVRSLRRLEKFLYRRADLVVALADGAATTIRDATQGQVQPRVIPNGADMSTLGRIAPRHDSDQIVFLYAGAHGPANGLHHVLTAAEAVQGDLPHVEFLLVGDGVEKESLITRANSRGIANVTFLDPVPKRDMPQLLGNAQVGLHVLEDVPLFRYGVSPNKLFDYMGAGLPTITNCPGDIGDMVKDARAGIAVAADDLETAVRTMAATPAAMREKWGESGRQLIATNYSRDIAAKELRKVIDQATK